MYKLKEVNSKVETVNDQSRIINMPCCKNLEYDLLGSIFAYISFGKSFTLVLSLLYNLWQFSFT